MKCGNLNFLEPSGPLQACNGIALPFTLSCSSLRPCQSFGKAHCPNFQDLNSSTIQKATVSKTYCELGYTISHYVNYLATVIGRHPAANVEFKHSQSLTVPYLFSFRARCLDKQSPSPNVVSRPFILFLAL